MLTHLEEWGYQHGGDEFGDLILGNEVLTHLEEWICQDDGENLADSTSPVPHTGSPGTRVPTPSDRRIRFGTGTSMADVSPCSAPGASYATAEPAVYHPIHYDRDCNYGG